METARWANEFMRTSVFLAAVGLAASPPVLAQDAIRSYSAVSQDGDSNYGYIEQISATSSLAHMAQFGNGNAVGSINVQEGGIFSRFEQLGIVQMYVTNADAYVIQLGDANSAWVLQHFGANNNVLVSQGFAFIDFETGTFVDGGPAYGSYVHVDQRGFDNDSRILQFGTNNLARTTQVGTGGDVNVARVTQMGGPYSGGVSQYGAGNRGVVFQH
jgi:hypothetical protein